MQKAPIPHDEKKRLQVVRAVNILDTPPEPRFDTITQEACDRFKVPISTISIIDENREWFKSCQGVSAKEGKRDVSFCGHAMLAKLIFIIEDTLRDERFADNPMVVGDPHIRFYAGVALKERQTQQPIGVFCIKDTKPRTLSAQEMGALLELAKRAEDELNTR